MEMDKNKELMKILDNLAEFLDEEANPWILVWAEPDTDVSQVRIHGSGPKSWNIGLLESAKAVLLQDVLVECMTGEEEESSSYM